MVIKRNWKGMSFRVRDGDLVMISPSEYLGIEGYGNKKITKDVMKTVVADCIDPYHRRIPYMDWEEDIIKKFSPDEQREVFGKVLIANKKLKDVS